jgi:hypothetical protein
VKQARDTGKLQEFEFTAEFKPARCSRRSRPCSSSARPRSFKKVVDELWTGWVAGDIKQPDGSNLDPSRRSRRAAARARRAAGDR